MSERYSRLYSLPENLYASGSPVIISAGALLKDNQTGKVLAQLKLKNIAGEAIKAARISIMPFDTIGNPLGAEIEYQYLDLSAKRDEDFGAKSPIFLPDTATRQFSVAVTEVAFADNTVWKADGASWDALPEFKNLISLLKDREMVNQFQIKYGEICRYVPETHKDLWYCTCNAINRQGEDKCHHCRRSLSALMAIDLTELREECNKRLAAEAKKAAEEKAAAEARAKKQKKAATIIISIAVAAIVVGCLLKWVVIPTVKYNQAVSLLESGQYDEAVAAFEAMESYKDSDSMVIETKYQKSVALMNAGDYDAAIVGFKELAEIEEANAEADKSTEEPAAYETPAVESSVESSSDEPYKPNQFIKKYGKLNQYGSYSDDVTECIYRMGMEAFDAGSYDEAIDAFEATDGYKDSAEQIAACETAILDGRYNDAVALMDAGQYELAIAAFEALDGHIDSEAKIDACEVAILDEKYDNAVDLMNEDEAWEAYNAFVELGSHKDSAEKAKAIHDEQYQKVHTNISSMVDNGEYSRAVNYFNENWGNTFGTVFKPTELMDYYRYAEMMVQYETGKLISLGDYLAALNEISTSFKDVSTRISRVQAYAGIWIGETYTRSNGYRNVLYEKMISINFDELLWNIEIDTVTDGNHWTWLSDYSGDLSACVKDGEISDVQFEYGCYIWRLSLTGSGTLYAVMKYGDEISNSGYNGTYTKVNE